MNLEVACCGRKVSTKLHLLRGGLEMKEKIYIAEHGGSSDCLAKSQRLYRLLMLPSALLFQEYNSRRFYRIRKEHWKYPNI